MKAQLRGEFWRRLEPEPFSGAPPPDWGTRRREMDRLECAVGDLLAEHVDVAFDYGVINERAEKYAEICRRFASLKFYPDYRRRYANENGDHKIWHAKIRWIEEFCAGLGIAPPGITKYCNARGRVRRACSGKFWRRRLLVYYGRRAEHATRKAGLVQRRRSLYVSGLAYRAHREKTRATERWLKECRAISDAGDQLSLWSVREASQANPALRRAELMTRLRGFEEIADELGHVGEFITLTCPSEYHATNADGTPNQNYAGHTVKDAQAWLQKMWARSRAGLKRKGVTVYGFRIAEPHHDGTPHWHMVLFTLAHHRRALRRMLAGHWLSEGGRDAGAKDHRIKFKAIDRSKGSAAGYLAKYVAKNIDGFEVGDDLETDARPQSVEEMPGRRDAALTARRVAAWASLHGIRQFQQVGGPPVTIYRECRRMREPVELASIERARIAADSGEWADFIRATGGIAAGRAGSLALWSEIAGDCNQYDELRGPQIVGIRGAEGGIRTHEKIWRIEQCGYWNGSQYQSSRQSSSPDLSPGRTIEPSGSYLGPVSITVRAAPAPGDPVSWSNPNETSMYGPN
ncbi:MAG: replication endonuclease [Acidiferrobacteraceae bacterium]